MANLLELVDQLIGNVLEGNVFNNLDKYVDRLNEIGGNNSPHPHSNLAGSTPGQHKFPVNDTSKIHDNRHDFLNASVSPTGKQAVSTPFVKRQEIYHPNQPIPDVNKQLNDVSSPLDTLLTREQIYHPNQPTKNITGQYENISKNETPPPNEKIRNLGRDEIYQLSDYPSILQGSPVRQSNSNSGTPLGSIPSDISEQIKSKRDDLRNNLYNDGPLSFVQGGKFAAGEAFIGPLRNFDIFAIAHWVRNIRKRSFIFT